METKLTLLLALLSLLVRAESNVFSCSDPWCNPHHQPYPNVKATMTGYNIVKGNPFSLSKQHDPGFATSYIFQALVPADGGGYKLHPGITVRQVVKCDLSLVTSVITNAKAYQETLSQYSSKGTDFVSNLDIGVRANIKGVDLNTTIPPLIQASFSASREYKNNVEFFSKTHGVLTVNDATCSSYTTHMSSYNPPAFSVAFERALRELNSATHQAEDIKEREFLQFIDNFGTHFLQEVSMGARLAISRRYKREEYRRSTEDTLQQCNSWRLKISLGASVSRNETKCDSIQTDTLTTIDDVYIREYISSYGSRPARDLIEWSQQKFESPLPIKMSLSPILNLFQSSFMKPYPDIDYVAILQWFAPRYFAYCTTYKDQLGAETCNNEVKKGCGWNDNCLAKTQQCIENKSSSNGYTCCTNGCEGLPCLNGGKCFDLERCNVRCECAQGYAGSRCQDKLIIPTVLSTEVGDYLRAHQTTSNDDVRALFPEILQNLYSGRYFMTLMVYNQVSGDDHHYVYGNFVSHFQKYNRNTVVAWTNKMSRVPSISEITDFKKKLEEHVTNRGCHPRQATDQVAGLVKQTGYPVQMIAVVRFGNGLRYSSYSPYNIFLNYVCQTTSSWGKVTRHENSLLVAFGEN